MSRNDTFGWRFAFLFQGPILLLSFASILILVRIPLKAETAATPLRERLRRIDLLGSITLVGSIALFLLAVSFRTTEELPWAHPTVVGLLFSAAVFAILFVLVEKRWASHPVLPIALLIQRTPLSVSSASFFSA
jgi:hypothetical protein